MIQGRGETMSTVLDWALLIMNLFLGDAERYAKKAFELLDSENFDVKSI